ncbi:MAG: nucleotidyltransferase domain-containing protein [Anaerolineae bacterium]
MNETETHLQKLLDKLLKNLTPEKVVVFGSYAAGTATPQSDIDLLVVWDSDLPRDQRQEIISRALRPRKTPVDILAYTSDEVKQCLTIPHSFVRHILETGKVLYERPG